MEYFSFRYAFLSFVLLFFSGTKTKRFLVQKSLKLVFCHGAFPPVSVSGATTQLAGQRNTYGKNECPTRSSDKGLSLQCTEGKWQPVTSGGVD